MAMESDSLPTEELVSEPSSLREPSWFPSADATPEEGRRWLREFSGWALSDDEEDDLEEEDY